MSNDQKELAKEINLYTERHNVLVGIIEDCGETAAASGWWNKDLEQDPEKLPELLMLTVTELAEAMQAYRRVGPNNVVEDTEKDNFTEEMADTVIRIFDLAYRYKMPLAMELLHKMEKNKERPYRHGGKHA